jgi:hypothetical protein
MFSMAAILPLAARVLANLNKPYDESDVVIITCPVRHIDFLASVFGAPRLQSQDRSIDQKFCRGTFRTWRDASTIFEEALFLEPPAVQLDSTVFVIHS